MLRSKKSNWVFFALLALFLGLDSLTLFSMVIEIAYEEDIGNSLLQLIFSSLAAAYVAILMGRANGWLRR